MDTRRCSVCKDLEQAFKSRRGKYIESRTASYYQVSTELAAFNNVEMERAKSDMDEHQLICASAVELRPEGMAETVAPVALHY